MTIPSIRCIVWVSIGRRTGNRRGSEGSTTEYTEGVHVGQASLIQSLTGKALAV